MSRAGTRAGTSCSTTRSGAAGPPCSPVRRSRCAAPLRFVSSRPGRTQSSSPSAGPTARDPPGRGSSRRASGAGGCSSAGGAGWSAGAASRHTRCSSTGGAPAGFRQFEQSRTCSSPPTTPWPCGSRADAIASRSSLSTAPEIAAVQRFGSSAPSSFQGCRRIGRVPTWCVYAPRRPRRPASPPCARSRRARACRRRCGGGAGPHGASRARLAGERRADPAESRHVRLARRVAPAARLGHRAGEPPLRVRPGHDPAGVHDDPDLPDDRPELLDDTPAERDLLRPLLLAGRRSPEPSRRRAPPTCSA